MFKRPSETSPANIKKRKEDTDPHLCLECGSELVRGRDSYKLRHWQQCHKNSEKDYRTHIVPKSHEKARSLLKQKKLAQSKKNLIPIQRKINEQPVIDDLDPNKRKFEENEIENIDEPNEVKSQEKFNISEISGIDIQPMLESYFEKEGKSDDEPATLEQLRNDISRVLTKLDSLSIKDHPSQAVQSKYSSNISNLNSVHNLMEICHPDILVETLEDGCRVTCIPCKDYFAAHMHIKM